MQEVTLCIDERVADRLTRHRDKILHVWERRVRKSFDLAKHRDRTALLDGLPDFIRRLAQLICHPSPSEVLEQEAKRLAEEHGEQRARFQGYSLIHVIEEYRILREVIFEVLEEEEPLKKRERDLILDAVMLAIRDTAHRYYDIKERQRSQALWQSQEMFQHLVEGVKDYAIFTVDPDGNVTTWNKGAERMKEYKPEEIVGEHFSRLYPLDARQRDEPMLHLKQALERGRFRGEGWRVKKSGEMFLADVCITPMFENNQLVGFSKVVADLTERSHIVQEHELSQGQVSQLEAERELRDKFVFALTHDLRTPLLAAKMSAQILNRGLEDKEEASRFAGQIVENLDRADALMRNFLDASRIKAGERLPISINECSLNDIVRDAVKELASMHGDRFVLKESAEIRGHWDCSAVRRIVENLASNGVKYGSEKDPVTITLIETALQVQIMVHNAGSAIPAHEQERLFELFRRMRNPHSEAPRGWGIGLTLVRGFAEAHGGSVRVESVEGEGTTFKVDLPKDARVNESPVNERGAR